MISRIFHTFICIHFFFFFVFLFYVFDEIYEDLEKTKKIPHLNFIHILMYLIKIGQKTTLYIIEFHFRKAKKY